MDSFFVSANLNQEDWNAYRRAVGAQIRSSASIWWRAALFAAISIAAFAALSLDLPIAWSSFLLGVAATFVLLAISYRIDNGTAQRTHQEAFVGVITYEISSDGILTTRNGVKSSIEWSEIKELTIAADYLFIWLKHPAAFVIPVRDFPPNVTGGDFVAHIRLWMASKSGAESPAVVDPGSLTLNEWLAQRNGASTSKLPEKRSLTKTLLRLLLLIKSQGSAIKGSDRSILALASLSLMLWVVIGRVQVGGDAELHIYNLPALSFIVVALLLLALMFARMSQPNIEFRRVLVIVLAVLPVVILATALFAAFLSRRQEMLALFLLFAYVTVYMARSLGALSGAKQFAAAVRGMVLCVAAWFVTSSYLYLDASLWFDPTEAEESANEWKSARDKSEEILFSQSARIDARIEAISRPEKTISANFFVGFAGVGEEKVFAEEIKLASKVIGERFGVDNRSLLLINDRRDVDTNPLASATNLHYALSSIAKKMNVDRDVLFLSLSSHGSAEPELSVSNTAIPLNDLSGEDLTKALNDSGIKWRVVIISACHSGAFIGGLENPNTAIITASAADKTSFGCSDDRDLTYFGEAFYRDALPKSESLLDAFNVAKVSITEREKKEGMKPSDPQISLGAELARKLSELSKPIAAK